MKISLQLPSFLLLINLFCGCDQLSTKLGLPAKVAPGAVAPAGEKTVSEKASGAEAPTIAATKDQQINDAAQFNADYEKWKVRAVEEFPEIGIAGSRFNQQFLLEAKKLRETNAPDLAHPNWPYLLALQVNTSIEKSKNSPPSQTIQREGNTENNSAQTNAPPPPERQDSSERFGSYAVADLTKMRPLPTGGVFKGTITRVEKQVAAGDLDIVLILDGLLSCEINLDRNTTASRNSMGYYEPFFYYRGSAKHSNLLEVIQEQNSLKLVEKQTASSRSSYTGRTYTQTGRMDVLTLRVGQTVSVEGMLLLKANKKLLLKGIIKSD